MKMQHIEEIFCSGALLILVLLVFLSASLRWFGIDMSWSIDMAQLSFAWICFIGADLAMRRKRHMGVEMFVEKLPHKLQLTIYLINSIAILVFLVFIFYYGTNLCIANYQRKFNTLPISYSFVTLSAPVGALLMSITTVRHIIEDIMRLIGIKGKEDKYETLLGEESDII